MGNTGSPAGNRKNKKTPLTELFKSLVKGDSTTILSDTRQVTENFAKSENKKKSGSLSMWRLMDVDFSNINYTIDEDTGELIVSGGTIIIKSCSKFFELADTINRLTEYDNNFFSLYKGPRTKRYYAILFFLIKNIAWMRNERSKRSNKILYSSLYEATGAAKTSSRKQTKDMMYKILDQVFKQAGHITGYKETTSGDGVILYYTKAGQITHK